MNTDQPTNPHRGSDFNEFLIEQGLTNTDQPMTPHYYVYALNYGSPTVRHATLAEAQAEAERLAEKHPGRAFEILRSVGIAQTSKASTFWMDGERPPHSLGANAAGLARDDGEEAPEKPRYRMLEHGETIQTDDEFTIDDGVTWKPAADVGTDYLDSAVRHFGRWPHFPHRRPQ